MIVPLLLFALGEPTLSFEALAPAKCPTGEAVEKVLGVCAAGTSTFALRRGSDTYLTRWHPRVVIDIDWQFDNNRVARVTRLKVRLKREGENFLPFRRVVEDKEDMQRGQRERE